MVSIYWYNSVFCVTGSKFSVYGWDIEAVVNFWLFIPLTIPGIIFRVILNQLNQILGYSNTLSSNWWLNRMKNLGICIQKCSLITGRIFNFDHRHVIKISPDTAQNYAKDNSFRFFIWEHYFLRILQRALKAISCMLCLMT